MNKIFLLIMMVTFTAVTYAQIVDVPMITTTGKNDKPIELSLLKISVFVVENIATTTIEMHFFNNNNNVMEGELNFPLPNGVSVSRFALDVNGEMREGVVVEKEKATQAFEAVIRKKVDPGIVEVTKGNNFKARVYPIPANGYKKAIIAFDQVLKGDDDNYIYQLPLNIKHELKDFFVNVEVVMSKPKLVKSKQPTVNLNFTEERNSYVSEYHEANASLHSQLAFSMPKPLKVEDIISYKGTVSSDNYFYVNLNVKREQRAKVKPKNIAVVWDESSSSKNRDLNKELTILSHYFKWLNSGQVKLITFSNTLSEKQTFKIVDGECSALIDLLKSIPYDGGTNLGVVDFSIIDSDEILLFTDAISNFGEKIQSSFSSPILAINSSNICNHNLLEHFASSSNGLYVNALELSVDDIIERATCQQKQFIKADFNSEKVKELYPNVGSIISDDFSCAGIIEGAKSDLTLHFGYGKEITESHTLSIDNTQSKGNNLGERIWAQKKLKKLLVEDNTAAIKAHGKKYSLVTPSTSLIVLDNVEDYVRYEIVPPKSLQGQYYEIIASRNRKTKTDKQERVGEICRQFEADSNWWESVIDYRNVKEELIEKPNGESFPPVAPVTAQSLSPRVTTDMDLEQEMVISLDEMNVSEIAFSSSSNTSRSAKSKKAEKPAIPTLEIKAWDSNATYINDLKSVDVKDVYSKYLDIKPEYEHAPSFYFDVATYMFQKSLMDEGLRVISNLAELELENVEILRTLGRKLSEFKFYKEAIAVFQEVMQTRSFEPHSYIDLGLTYAENGEYQKAIDNLYTVIEKNWDSDIITRFPGIELITLHDINNIIYHHEKELNTSFINPCFLKNMALDIRVVIDWDANDTDIDLWVSDPRKEKCSYSNQNTRIGGKISNDITQGYGPEEFRLKHAINGNYIVEAKFFNSGKQSVMAKVTVRAFIYTKFDTKEENKKVLTLQLEPNKEGEYTIGEIEFIK